MPDDDPTTTGSERFPTTAWSFIAQTQASPADERAALLNQLITRYWKPVFKFLRVRGYPLHDAEDLTQEFFCRFLQGDWLRRADPARGRFRTFLLTTLVRFLSDQGPRRAPRQQTFERQLVPVGSLLGDAERSWDPPAGETPETVFMRQWAADLFDAMRGQLKELCRKKDRSLWYDIFEAAHAGTLGEAEPTQQELAARFGLTRHQVRHALEQVQQWSVVLLRTEVGGQVGSEAEVGEEIRELLALLEH